MKIDFNEAAGLLKNCGNAYILIHQSPDGDCTGLGRRALPHIEIYGKKKQKSYALTKYQRGMDL